MLDFKLNQTIESDRLAHLNISRAKNYTTIAAMSEIVAVTNQKGGVGKTTSSINLTAALARAGKKMLLVDLDPQCNATVGSGIKKSAFEVSVYDVIMGDAQAGDALISTESGYDVLPAQADLAGASLELAQIVNRERRLKGALDLLRGSYDFIMIDCPPALDLLTVNALTAADSVLIPVQCEYYALEGLSSLLDTISKIRESLNPKLELKGLLRTMFDGRNSLANEVSNEIKQYLNSKVFKTVVPRNIRLAEAPSYGKPVIDYDPTCSGSQAYLALAGEILSLQKSK